MSSKRTIDWLGLDTDIIQLVSKHFVSPLQLQASIDDESDVVLIMEPYCTSIDTVSEVQHRNDRLWNWYKSNDRNWKRVRRELHQQYSKPSFVANSSTDSGAFYDELVHTDVVLSRVVAKSSLSRRIQQGSVSKDQLEANERDKYSLLIAEWIIEAGLPIVETINQTSKPSESWKRVFGKRRAKTLRNRYRAWRPINIWMNCIRGYTFPCRAQDMLDYLEDRCTDVEGRTRCGKSIPQMVAGALHLLESVGMVPDPISQQRIWIEAVDFWNTELARGNTRRKVAQLFPISMLISAEIFVCNETASNYLRALCWLWLVMHWCSLRADDCQGIDPSRMNLGAFSWKGVLIHTKTSGAGRKAAELPIFVSRSANLSSLDWLEKGFSLWQSPQFNFTRRYFVMDCDKQMNDPVDKYLEPQLMNDYFKHMLKQLGTLSRPTLLQTTWTAYDEPLVVDEMLCFWTGHSPRHWAPSLAAAMGVSKEERLPWAMGSGKTRQQRLRVDKSTDRHRNPEATRSWYFGGRS